MEIVVLSFLYDVRYDIFKGGIRGGMSRIIEIYKNYLV